VLAQCQQAIGAANKPLQVLAPVEAFGTFSRASRSAGLRWENKENIWFWHHASLAASTASGTQLQQPQPTPECIAGLGGGGGLEMENFGY
jgi:hypothetical protein